MIRLRRFKTLLMVAAMVTPVFPGSAQAAPPTIAGKLTAIATPIEAIKLPLVGNVGEFSVGTIGTLPGLSKVKVPVFGSLSGLPEVGTLTVSDGLGLVESLAVLQFPLRGIEVGHPSGLVRH